MEQDVADAIEAIMDKLNELDRRTLPLVDFGLVNDVNQVKEALLDLGDRVKALEAKKP